MAATRKAASGTLFLMLDEYVEKREKHGPDWCRRKLIGPKRERFRELPPQLCSVISGTVEWSLREGFEDAQRTLGLFCTICGQCELGRPGLRAVE